VATAYITHPSCLKHDMGPYHPECPDRLNAISDRMIAAGLDGHLVRHTAPAATREQLLRVHGATYVDEIERASPRDGLVYLDPGHRAQPAFGRGREARGRRGRAGHRPRDEARGRERVLRGAPAGPPRRAAPRDGLLHLQQRRGRRDARARAAWPRRVAVIDFDVHHGNGTEDAFSTIRAC
jgi:acetoin utilization deacetylase AcuC-like enzyme